jgi:hypothetical protein
VVQDKTPNPAHTRSFGTNLPRRGMGLE